jgi:hypothetical protein
MAICVERRRDPTRECISRRVRLFVCVCGFTYKRYHSLLYTV